MGNTLSRNLFHALESSLMRGAEAVDRLMQRVERATSRLLHACFGPLFGYDRPSLILRVCDEKTGVCYVPAPRAQEHRDRREARRRDRRRYRDELERRKARAERAALGARAPGERGALLRDDLRHQGRQAEQALTREVEQAGRKAAGVAKLAGEKIGQRANEAASNLQRIVSAEVAPAAQAHGRRVLAHFGEALKTPLVPPAQQPTPATAAKLQSRDASRKDQVWQMGNVAPPARSKPRRENFGPRPLPAAAAAAATTTTTTPEREAAVGRPVAASSAPVVVSPAEVDHAAASAPQGPLRGRKERLAQTTGALASPMPPPPRLPVSRASPTTAPSSSASHFAAPLLHLPLADGHGRSASGELRAVSYDVVAKSAAGIAAPAVVGSSPAASHAHATSTAAKASPDRGGRRRVSRRSALLRGSTDDGLVVAQPPNKASGPAHAEPAKARARASRGEGGEEGGEEGDVVGQEPAERGAEPATQRRHRPTSLQVVTSSSSSSAAAAPPGASAATTGHGPTRAEKRQSLQVPSSQPPTGPEAEDPASPSSPSARLRPSMHLGVHGVHAGSSSSNSSVISVSSSHGGGGGGGSRNHGPASGMLSKARASFESLRRLSVSEQSMGDGSRPTTPTASVTELADRACLPQWESRSRERKTWKGEVERIAKQRVHALPAGAATLSGASSSGSQLLTPAAAAMRV